MWATESSSDDSSRSTGGGGGPALRERDESCRTNAQVRDIYCASIELGVGALQKFVVEHMVRATNTASSEALRRAVAAAGNQNRDEDEDEETAAAAAAGRGSVGAKWQALASGAVSVLMALSDVESHTGQPGFFPASRLEVGDLAVAATALARTLTLLFFAANAFAAVPQDNAEDNDEEGNADDEGDGENNEQQQQRKKKRQLKKKRKQQLAAAAAAAAVPRFWFEIASKAKRKAAKLEQVSLLIHIARALAGNNPAASVGEESNAEHDDDEDDDQEDEEENDKKEGGDGDGEKQKKKHVPDLPECADAIARVDAIRATIAGSGSRRAMAALLLSSTSDLDAQAQTRSFWGRARHSSHAAAAASSSLQRRQRGGAVGDASFAADHFCDQYGTIWTPSLRGRCALLGAMVQLVRGSQLQLEYDVARAGENEKEDENSDDDDDDNDNEENEGRGFALPPVPFYPLSNQAGWVSRFAPPPRKILEQEDIATIDDDEGDDAEMGDEKQKTAAKAKEQQQQQQQRTPLLWCFIHKELKKFGVRERLIRQAEAQDEEAEALKNEQQQPENGEKEEEEERKPGVSFAWPLEAKQEEKKHEDEKAEEDDKLEAEMDPDRRLAKLRTARKKMLSLPSSPVFFIPTAASLQKSSDKKKNSVVEADDDGDGDARQLALLQRRKRQQAVEDEAQLQAARLAEQRNYASREFEPYYHVPSALSRLVYDRSLARQQVHGSFTRIQNLVADLKAEVAHFSECAEASRILEGLLNNKQQQRQQQQQQEEEEEDAEPLLLTQAKRDVARLKQCFELLLAACAVCVAAPALLLEASAEEFEDRVAQMFLPESAPS